MLDVIDHAFTLSTLTAIVGAYVWIVRDNKSRKQLASLIRRQNERRTYRVLLEKVVRWASVVGDPLSFRAVDIFSTISSLYIVIALATSEVYGSAGTFGQVHLVRKNLSASSRAAIAIQFALLLLVAVAILRSRTQVVNWLRTKSVHYGNHPQQALAPYWTVLFLLAGLLMVEIYLVGSSVLFTACLVIACLSLLGSISTNTRAISIAMAAALPVAISLLDHSWPLIAVLAFFFLITTPINAFWDGFAFFVNRILLIELLGRGFRWYRILIHAAIAVMIALVVSSGFLMTLGLAFGLYNGLAKMGGESLIDWSEYFHLGSADPWHRGLLMSTMCLVKLLPSWVNLLLGFGALSDLPVPFKSQVETLCLKERPTRLELSGIVCYLTVGSAVVIYGGLYSIYGLAFVMFNLLELFFASGLSLAYDLLPI